MELSSLKSKNEVKTYVREITENLSHNDPSIRKEALKVNIILVKVIHPTVNKDTKDSIALTAHS